MEKENELKYIVDDNIDLTREIIQTFVKNDFNVLEISKITNNDRYYDTKDVSLYKSNSSLRIRKVIKDNKEVSKGTFKSTLTNDKVYSSRREIEFDLEKNSFTDFIRQMEQASLINFKKIMKFPTINSINERVDVLLEKNNNKICLSFDDCIYINYLLNGKTAKDKMIEIESINLIDSLFLDKVNNIIKENHNNLIINKQSKYERAIEKTFSQNKKAILKK